MASATHTQWLEQFLEQLNQGGWQEVFSDHGWDLSIESLQTPLTINRKSQGFDEFSNKGTKAIEPGDPALSLLYHALMHPGIQSDAITFWPDLQDIDALENYIYSLKPVSQEQAETLMPVVMAYEYRITQRTPHQCHADLIFSRTGVGRVGTDDPEYSAQRRCFSTDPANKNGGTRVQPARYAVFLCKVVLFGNEVSVQGEKHSKDEQRVFYVPVTKLYDGMDFMDKPLSLTFRHFHQSDKLSRMVSKGKLVVDASFDIDKPPFYYSSDNDDIVAENIYSGSIVVWRKAQTMCRMAKQSGRIVTFKVPKESFLWLKEKLSQFKNLFFYNNRRYTSLRVGQNIFWVILDAGLNALLKKFNSDKRVFLSPRPAGEFTNIRHILDDNNQVVDLNFLPKCKFKSTLAQGGYQAIMYEDPVVEGYISADFEGAEILGRKPKPAYSLMTAPDFMPRVGNIDIYGYEEIFVIGGPRALCEGRLPVNLRFYYPDSYISVFSDNEQTVTAITALPRTNNDVGPAKGTTEYDNTHYMTDEASDIFAPGWDVTYARDSLFSSPYYHTSGLGSPFLEDVKLCAAANGMWPAASPDAARTFRRKTRTALPLTDEEIGLSPESALAQNSSMNTRGWDGEYGPFLQLKDEEVVVNYASIERSDYISNYDNSDFDFAKLRGIDRVEADRRLASLLNVHKLLLEKTKTPLDESPYWLVSFVTVDQWQDKKHYVNVPTALLDMIDLDKFLTPDIGGYFYIFATYSIGTESTEKPIRRTQKIDSLHFVKALTDQSPEFIEHSF